MTLIRNKKSSTGFSLMEVLASLVILSVVATGVVANMSLSKKAAVGTEDKMNAILIAEKKMVEIKADFSKTGIAISQPNVPVPEFNGLMNIEASGTDANRGLKRVAITISWTDKASIPRHETLVTYMYKE